MNYVYSTLTCDNAFAVYAPKNDARQLSVIKKKILIKGGHGIKVVDANNTPRGVVTIVSDEDMELLEKNHSFNVQKKAGYIVVERTLNQKAPEVVAEDMNPKDASAPLTPADFQEGEVSTPETKVYKQKKGK
jgi:hypothetical protein